MAELNSLERQALLNLPGFKEELARLQGLEAESKAAKDAARTALHQPCAGGTPQLSDIGYSCSACGLQLKFRDYLNRDWMQGAIREKRWIHRDGGNPCREDGLSGKAAAAADGDWYGSH